MRTLLFILIVLAPVFAGAESGLRVGALDDREYRHITLENQLEVMLVSDPGAQDAAASLDVAVGHGSDPEGREGLAHFLEHMLFLGTEKYPEAGEYQAFIKDHGGSHNAYTSYGHTNYFFSVQTAHLEPALDRFSQFFVAPLFNQDLVKRERVIVHSEYSSRKRGEGRRTLAAKRQLMNQAHPLSRFAVGSLKTLADRPGQSVRDDLIHFYREHYSANLMRLAVVGPQSLDTLESWVRPRFSRVPNRNVKRFVADQPLYLDSQLPAFQLIRPLKERRNLNFAFPVPSTIGHYRSKPVSYIANILGHEGEGSLLSLLKKRGWAQALSAGVGTMDGVQGTVEISISLTPAGVEKIAEIGELLFALIRSIEQQGIERWRFDEQKQLGEISFNFAEKSDPPNLVRGLTGLMQDYPWREVFSAIYLFDQFDPELIRRYLALMRPERVIVTLTTPEVETDRIAPDFETEYGIRRLEEGWVSLWAAPGRGRELSLPAPNPFIPTELGLVESSQAESRPGLLIDTPAMQLWHRTDTEFGVPRANFFVSFRSPVAAKTPRAAVLADLLTRMAQERLNEWSYPAAMAGLGFEIYPHLRGLSFRLRGYTEKQGELLKQVLASLNTREFDQRRFERIRTQLLRHYRNRMKERPSSLAVSELRWLLMQHAWPVQQRIEALSQIDVRDLQGFAEQLFRRGNVLALSHGSRTPEQAKAMAMEVERALPGDFIAEAVPRSPVLRLASEQDYLRMLGSKHQDSLTAIYLQGRSDQSRERALFYLLNQLLEAEFYTELRTRQKLGYVVQSTVMPVMEVPGMLFLVQSPTVSAAASETAIRQFLRDYRTRIAELDEQAFEQAKQALIMLVLKKDTALGDRTSRYWLELDRQEFEFNSQRDMAEAIRSSSHAEILELYDRLINPGIGGIVLRAQGTLVAAPPENQVSYLRIRDHDDFKQNLSVF